MLGRGTNEVRNSLLELTRIYKPKDPRKFVKDFVRKYRISGGYEEELTSMVRVEMARTKSG